MKPSPSNEPVTLVTGYYLDNFFKILDFVDRWYDDILGPDEWAFSRAFRAVPLPAQRLYVRLLMRKGPFFRCDKLAYPEIEDVPAAVNALAAAGLLRCCPFDEPRLVFALLARAEVEALLRAHRDALPEETPVFRKLKKPELIALVVTHLDPSAAATWLQARFNWVALLGEDVLLRYRLLFFGNSRQDWTEFVLLDLGLLRYEPVVLLRGDRWFQSRALLDASVAWLEKRALCDLAMEAEDEAGLAVLGEAMPPTYDERVLIRRRDRLLNSVGAWLERRGSFEAALAWYHDSSRPPSRERQARLLDKLGRPRQAMAMCRALLDGPATEEERLFANAFRVKVAKKLGHSMPAPKRASFPNRTLTLVRDARKRIEHQVLEHLQEQGMPGFGAENWFWLSVFGLIFWDIVYAPVRGAFFNHYQRGPADLFSNAFLAHRHEAVQARLDWLRLGLPWLPLAQKVMDEKWGVNNYLVGWDPSLREHVARIHEQMHGKALAVLFERLVTHPGLYRTGFPDLLLFPPEGGYRLAEVKGPGDQLQPNQRGWLKYFQANGIPIEVVRVVWQTA
ncbi:VRR-NUC domain-containing protein [Acanthopleuribacter pedis]|uniref:phosphodiesterase I n=1 Tax=Acanthopleuribacter pedis TaxID=442870 RepID=A0A8J7QFJ8_9BACT|nr:VRR-NUC domain-containing protein [Acanthopleuribacter pedis]MBO1317530.1 VRR-NUC domain-containing protein [Acanthopleuribacter pedis]